MSAYSGGISARSASLQSSLALTSRTVWRNQASLGRLICISESTPLVHSSTSSVVEIPGSFLALLFSCTTQLPWPLHDLLDGYALWLQWPSSPPGWCWCSMTLSSHMPTVSGVHQCLVCAWSYMNPLVDRKVSTMLSWDKTYLCHTRNFSPRILKFSTIWNAASWQLTICDHENIRLGMKLPWVSLHMRVDTWARFQLGTNSLGFVGSSHLGSYLA